MTSQIPPLSKHATVGLVAAVLVAVSLAEGGYSAGVRAAIAFATWAVVLGGVALGVLPRSRIPPTALATGGLLAALALLSGISVAWAGDDGAAIEATVLVTAYLGLFTLVLCLAREGDSRGWLVGLAIGIAVVGVIALLARLIPGLPGGDDEIARLLPSAKGRLSYPIGYWNGIGALFAVGTVLFTWLSVAAGTRIGRCVAIAPLPVLVLSIYLASSRGGFVALAFGLVILVAIGPRRAPLLVTGALGLAGAGIVIALASGQHELLDATGSSEAKRQGLELLGATAACVVAVGVGRYLLDGAVERLRPSPGAGRVAVALVSIAAVVGVLAANPSERVDEFKRVPANEGAGRTDFIASHLSSGSGSGRWQFWGVALDEFGDHPVHGLGAGAYADYWNQHAPISRVTKQAHSLYLEELGDLGPLGLLAVGGFLLVPLLIGLIARPGLPGGEPGVAVAVLAAGVLSAGIDWTFQLPAVFAVVVIAAALLVGPSLLRAPDSGQSRTPPALLWRAGVVVAACLALLLSSDQLLAKRSLDASQSAVRDGDLAHAADEARRAIALQPWAAQPRLQLALVEEEAGALPEAEGSVAAAIERAPDDWSLWLLRARIATKEGRIAEADRSLERSRALNPRAPLFSNF